MRREDIAEPTVSAMLNMSEIGWMSPFWMRNVSNEKHFFFPVTNESGLSSKSRMKRFSSVGSVFSTFFRPSLTHAVSVSESSLGSSISGVIIHDLPLTYITFGLSLLTVP